MSDLEGVVLDNNSEMSKIIKRGETVTQVILHRSMKGVSLQVKAHPAIEEFARALGDGEAQDIKIYGRHWHAIGDKPLRIYNNDLKVFKCESLTTDDPGNAKIGFRYDQPGQPLIDGNGFLNISFLRLVGVSEGGGVTFGISGVYTLDSLKRIRDSISSACRKFYVHYMRPVDLSVTISTQDLQL